VPKLKKACRDDKPFVLIVFSCFTRIMFDSCATS